METAVLARHGETTFNVRGAVNGVVAVSCPLTPRGEEEASALGRVLADEAIDLCVTSEFERARQTADLALGVREVPRLVLPDLDDPNYGAFEGGLLEEYRAWASTSPSTAAPRGGGESRHALVARYARAFRTLLARTERRVLVVCHSLPVAYALSARDGDPPPARVPLVLNAYPYRFTREELERAADVLERWVEAPTW